MQHATDSDGAKLNACRPWVPASWRLLRLSRLTVLDWRGAVR